MPKRPQTWCHRNTSSGFCSDLTTVRGIGSSYGRSVTGTRAVLHGSTVRTGIGGSGAFVSRRALVGRRSSGHGSAMPLGALGPSCAGVVPKAMAKAKNATKAALGYAAGNRSMTTPRGALALAPQTYPFVSYCLHLSIAQRLPTSSRILRSSTPSGFPLPSRSPTRTGGMRRGRVQDGRRSDLTLPTRERRPICDANIPAKRNYGYWYKSRGLHRFSQTRRKTRAFVRLRTTI